MEKIEKTCTSVNSCEDCSSFNVTQSIIEEESIEIHDNCTEFFKSSFGQITTVYFEGKTKLFNQTRCCQGNRTLLIFNEVEDNDTNLALNTTILPLTDPTTITAILRFSIFSTKDASTNKGTISPDSRSSEFLSTTLITAALVGFFVILALILVLCCKRRSKVEEGTPNPIYLATNGTYNDGFAEYSTLEESASIVESLTHHRTLPTMNEAPACNYFILEPNIEWSSIPQDTPTIKLEKCETDEGVYNTLHEKDRRSKEIEENAYSHFVDFNNSFYSSTIHR